MSELSYKTKSKGLRGTILAAWLIAGTLDMSAAVIQTLINGGDPLRMMQFIASGVFGTSAFSSVMPYAVLGFLFHYVIAFGWTLLFFYIYPKFYFLSVNVLLTAVLYGVFVWAMMNLVVLPLANTPPIKFVAVRAVVAALILVVAIGMPLAFIAARYYRRP